jgi:ubiquinone/menaquinone biosynthesis C-methylase UbiE
MSFDEPMLAYAATRIAPWEGLEWRQADAMKLPFDDQSFDAVVCQFGLMFLPDKAAGAREAFRVLKLGRPATRQRLGPPGGQPGPAHHP